MRFSFSSGIKLKSAHRLARHSLLLIALTLAACGPSKDDVAKTPDASTTVAVAKVTREDLSKTVDLTAELLPWQQVEIHARVAGYVKQINVDVGDHAKTGDVLATLEIPEIEDEEKQADAAIATAQEQVKSLAAASEETNLLASRLAAAARETAGLVAQQDIDTANAKARANDADLAAARQKVVEAQAHANHLRDLVAFAKITAPFDGVVTRRYADTGTLVQPGTGQGGTANSGSLPLVSFAELKRLRLEFPVPEPDATSVHVGEAVQINLAGRTFPGRIARYAQKVDTSTRTMLTEVDLDNSHAALLPGMYATVRLTLARADHALSVPMQALNSGEHPSVWLVTSGKIEQRSVQVGMETADRAEIVSGLEDGDLVVVGSKGALQPGQSAHPRLVANQ